MKTKTYIPLLLAFAALAVPAPAIGSIIPGEPAKAAYGPGVRKSENLALLCDKYTVAAYQVRRMQNWVDSSTSDESKAQNEAWLAERRQERERLRAAIIARLDSHPDEVNDVLCSHDWFTSPLSCAVQVNDAGLVRLLLDRGALPFLGYAEGDFLGRDGDALVTPSRVDSQAPWQVQETSPEIREMIRHARSEYNVLEVMLQARARGMDLRRKYPVRPFPGQAEK